MATRERRSGTSAAPFSFEHFEWWSRRLILDNGSPFELEGFQAEFADDLFRGARECWLVLPEGNGKTTFVAAIALYGLRFAEDALIPVAASSRDQSRIMYRQAKGLLRRSRLDDPGFSFEAFDGYRRIDLRVAGKTKRGDVFGVIEIHAADAGTADGIIPFPYAFLDELHRHRDMDLYETWRGKLDKRGAQQIGISTAGEPGSPFELTRDRIRTETPVVERRPGFVRCRSDAIVFHEFALEEGASPSDMGAVKRCNPLESITEEGLLAKSKSPTMSPPHWSRFVCNLATRTENAAVSEVEWSDALSADGVPDGEPVVVGLDLGWKIDTTAIVPLWAPEPDRRVFAPAVILTPPADGSMLDPQSIKDAFLGIHERNRVECVVMDMHGGAETAAWLSGEIGCLVVDRQQTNSFKANDYARFMEGLREGWLKHSGDPGLTRHVMNAVAKELPGGDIVFARPVDSRYGGQARQQRRVIDGLVAAAMANSHVAGGSDAWAAEVW